VSAPVKHPVQRGGEGRSRFDHFSESASNLTSSPWFFWVCVALVLAWGLSYALGWPDTTRHFLGELLAALTLALVALLKNAELRAEHAIQYKLDAIAAAMLETRTDGDEREAADDLEAAIGRHEEV
jgi:low affinity Fe/Cu permease